MCKWFGNNVYDPTVLEKFKFGLSLWNNIWSYSKMILNNFKQIVGKGDKIRFWHDTWCGQMSLQSQFPHIFAIARNKDILLENAYGISSPLTWNVTVTRNLKEWEVEEYENILQILVSVKMGTETDKLSQNLNKNGSFTIKSLYRNLIDKNHSITIFPYKIIWNSYIPPKISVFAWEAVMDFILTLDNLMRRGFMLANWCVLCKQNMKFATIFFFSAQHPTNYGLWYISCLVSLQR